MEITFLGHASLHIKIEEINLVVDPFISGNPKAEGIDLNSIEADYILVTHAHRDHILDIEAIVKNNPEAKLISNYEIIQWYDKKGIQGHPLNHGGKKNFDFGILKYVNAIHSSVFPDGSNGGNPGGFVISTTHDKTVYIAGDTALTMDMKLLPLMFDKIDLAILPIGDNFTMGYEDAALASDFVKCDKVLGYHYNTFPPITLNKEEVLNYFKNKGKELLLPKIGESIFI
ncbi:metal-dependent hydrolase [uncultured Croceitalea sp.]|uniref:metal-dependent hydrolase n=1 Tax=uncultured Croceitalea sp. TaxID=1798908 RepID=UPI00374E8B33